MNISKTKLYTTRTKHKKRDFMHISWDALMHCTWRFLYTCIAVYMLLDQHVGAEAKLSPFRRWHFKQFLGGENVRIPIKISLKFVLKVRITNIPVLVGAKPLSVPMMINLLTHIFVTRPQWVNTSQTVYGFPRMYFKACILNVSPMWNCASNCVQHSPKTEKMDCFKIKMIPNQ